MGSRESIDRMMAAGPVVPGREDRFAYEISAEACIGCGVCMQACPGRAIEMGASGPCVDAARCIDCGSCAVACPHGAARPETGVRASLPLSGIDPRHRYFNGGCTLNLYKPDVAQGMLDLLRAHLGEVKPHTVCCRHDPALEPGSTIINNCAGCDRRFRSLYPGVNTVTVWEVLDAIPDLRLPDFSGLRVSVHDSCGFRHKPQVHAAVRSLLAKMGISVEESRFSGMDSVCCGDNLYGRVANDRVERAIRSRARQLPCEDVAVYCIGCVRAMQSAGKRAHYLPDLVMGRMTDPLGESLDEYHAKLEAYVARH